MRLKLILQHKPNQALPINYNYLISAWIYKTLGNADQEFANWLHENGFGFGGKKYKLFTFSSLQPQWFDIDPKRQLFILSKPPTVLELSFFVDETLKHLITGLFQNQKFSLGDLNHQVDFEVSAIEILQNPAFTNTMRFKTMTPVFISQNVEGDKNGQFLSPEDESYEAIFFQNLQRKISALNYSTGPLENLVFSHSFRLLSRPRSKMLHIKGSNKRGYLYDFEITAPVEMIEMGYFAGFGGQNSAAGMGMVRRLRLTEID